MESICGECTIDYSDGFADGGKCSHFENWEFNKQREALANSSEQRVENCKSFMKLSKDAGRLSLVGVKIGYYLVPREENADADALARGSLVIV